eukprot:TRINITY_DN10652_c0_g1_i1.p1 TRINITY_DN10652_c0_g1~~TRINITY_DN10652_c0_g1_i1.p1  ORF type:complete len:117 (+),score=25.46 TRINITY_DN10652_c0_g1_i1:67-417(+)
MCIRDRYMGVQKWAKKRKEMKLRQGEQHKEMHHEDDVVLIYNRSSKASVHSLNDSFSATEKPKPGRPSRSPGRPIQKSGFNPESKKSAAPKPIEEVTLSAWPKFEDVSEVSDDVVL